ncbi:N,N-dimethylformamidase beta subunit family domain-containing protein [Streptomyces globisporus]|uniref:N,N-dimethylformamidase beta subunit family domain-containing protein n=1 Tax=Streptomyces globisporus TaxID=1908 RepID=UPI0004C87CD0|nr:N,N-dimethylformamidase beta subunit family domain-containing protein [Streptomyces globisporus]
MSELSRRTILRGLGAGAGVAVAAPGALAGTAEAAAPVPPARNGDNPVVRENGAPGSDRWAVGCAETCGVDPVRPQIAGRLDRDSVAPGETLRLRLSRPGATVSVYRVGHYGGVRARHLLTATDAGTVWTLKVPDAWVSGLFLAVLTTPDGYRAHVRFVVREPARASGVLHLVSGKGGAEASVVRWLEEEGYDVTYATVGDVRAGRVDPARYGVLTHIGSRPVAARGARAVALPRPFALSEPGRIEEEARRAASEGIERAVSRSRS